ncbi:hypothetical protein [Natronorubrum sulfidifaciens]|uniref:hypothetical protein n=1 Tax=Natronorubrum sulfidifaciens TaxID=388259 RepID=UPI0006782576|nr:hypothetical protein [Natronorubrum sulfidifaciens]
MGPTNHKSTAESQSISKGTLAATGLAVGAGVAASTATAQDDETVVVPGKNYYPDTDFEVVVQFNSSTRDDILESYDDEFDNVSDWDAYAIFIDVGGSANVLGYLFVDEDDADVETGDTGTFGDEPSFRNAELDLIEVDPGV